MKIIVIYDDTIPKSEAITDIIGDRGFADVVVRKRRLEDYYHDEVEKIYLGLIWKKIHSVFEYADLIKSLEFYSNEDVKILHCFANYLISDSDKVALSYKKLLYIEEPFAVVANKMGEVAAVMFPCINPYIAFCRTIMSGQKVHDAAKNLKESFEIEGLIDIGKIGNFIQCITGNFDSRYFNSLQENEYTLQKSSTNKKKIKSEYNFYHLLPEDMKYWFVMPFNYQESENTASYTMERLHIPDLAIKWVHGSIDETEFAELLDKYFFFFKNRHSKECTVTEYNKVADALYIDKVNDRIAELKKSPEYIKMQKFLVASDELNIDILVAKYFKLKSKIESRIDYPKFSVIGHGDPCFANALYSKVTKTLKFIDPKGALIEADLWTNPYYDIAKLSHSICGRYDFFNNGLYDIKVDDKFAYDLDIPFDNTKYIKIFKDKAEGNGFDYLSIRIYETSLFLSMLPLHIDNPHKVFGFIINVNNILKEIESNV